MRVCLSLSPFRSLSLPISFCLQFRPQTMPEATFDKHFCFQFKKPTKKLKYLCVVYFRRVSSCLFDCLCLNDIDNYFLFSFNLKGQSTGRYMFLPEMGVLVQVVTFKKKPKKNFERERERRDRTIDSFCYCVYDILDQIKRIYY